MSVTLAGMNKDVRRAADELLDLGWSLNGHMLMPPAGSSERPVSLPGNSKQGPSRALKAALRRARDVLLAPQPTVEEMLDATTVVLAQASPEARHAALVDVELDQVVARGKRRREQEEVPEVTVTVDKPRHIVRVERWMARKAPGRNGGTVYPSEAVLQREWSDGTIDYVCAEDGCDYVSENPKSVSAHHGYHRRGVKWTPPGETTIDPSYTEPMSSRGYQPTERLVALVAEQVRLALAAGMDPESVAAALLEWFHERPDLPDPEPREPLTDAQIVERIRLLVSAPTAAAVAEAEAEAALLREQLALVIGERDRLVTERQALRDLLT